MPFRTGTVRPISPPITAEELGATVDFPTHLAETIQQGVHGGLPAHKTTHATGGADALTPADIGAAPSNIRADSAKELRVEVVSAYPAHAQGRVIFHTGEGKFKGSTGSEWL